MRIVVSYKDGDEISKFITECKSVKISKNEALAITNREDFFNGLIFKFDIPEGLSEKIEKWMFINGKYDFSGFKTYVITSKEKNKWLCVYNPEEEKNGSNNN